MSNLGYPAPGPTPDELRAASPQQPWAERAQRKPELPEPADKPRPPIATQVTGFLATAVYRGQQLLLVLVSLVGLLMLARLFLVAFRASATSPFVQFVYDRTNALVAPFHSMFPDQVWGDHPIEITTAIAMVVYGVVMVILVKAMELFLRPRLKPIPMSPSEWQSR